MDLFEHLVDEHRLILRTIDALEGFVSNAEKTRSIDQLELSRFVTFLREFVDLVHHEKEETILFPAMVKLGYAPAGAPIAHIRDEHRQEHVLLLEIRQAALRPGPPSSADRDHLLGSLRKLIRFEREHIRKENELLYPTVRREFCGTTLAALTRLVYPEGGTRERFAENTALRILATELIERHAPIRSAETPPSSPTAAPADDAFFGQVVS